MFLINANNALGLWATVSTSNGNTAESSSAITDVLLYLFISYQNDNKMTPCSVTPTPVKSVLTQAYCQYKTTLRGIGYSNSIKIGKRVYLFSHILSPYLSHSLHQDSLFHLYPQHVSPALKSNQELNQTMKFCKKAPENLWMFKVDGHHCAYCALWRCDEFTKMTL